MSDTVSRQEPNVSIVDQSPHSRPRRLFVGAIAGVDCAVDSRLVEHESRIDAGIPFAAVRELAQNRHASGLTAIGV